MAKGTFDPRALTEMQKQLLRDNGWKYIGMAGDKYGRDWIDAEGNRAVACIALDRVCEKLGVLCPDNDNWS